jgi:ABC-type Na+ efflux pump permease subunit
MYMDSVYSYFGFIIPIPLLLLLLGSFSVIIWGYVHACIIYFRTKNKDRLRELLVASSIFVIFVSSAPISPLFWIIFFACSLYLFTFFLPSRFGKQRSFKTYVSAVAVFFLVGIILGVFEDHEDPFGGLPSIVSTAPPVLMSDTVSQ